MRNTMRHTAVLVLGFMLVTLVVACGGTPQPTPAPTPDIEATVVARVEEKQEEDAALEAKVEAMAKAIGRVYCSGSAYSHAHPAYAYS